MSKSWKQYSIDNGIELNDQYFLIYCETAEQTSEFMDELRKKYGFKGIPVGPMGLRRGPWIFANLNTRFMFQGTIGVNTLSCDPVGNHAVTMDDFLAIADIFAEYEGYPLLKFPK